MEILITGGAGFIGSHILAQLQGRRDMDVVVFDNLSSGSKEHVPAGMELVEGDVCDEAAVDALGGPDDGPDFSGTACPRLPD